MFAILIFSAAVFYECDDKITALLEVERLVNLCLRIPMSAIAMPMSAK